MKNLYFIFFISFPALLARESFHRVVPDRDLTLNLANLVKKNPSSKKSVDSTGIVKFSLNYSKQKSIVTSSYKRDTLLFCLGLVDSLGKSWKVFPNESVNNIYADQEARKMDFKESGDYVIELNSKMRFFINLNTAKKTNKVK